MITRNKYDSVLNQFEINYPHFFERAVDWWATGKSSIAIKLDNGEIIDYDRIKNTIIWIRTDNPEVDEETRRKAFGRNLEKRIPLTGMSKGDISEKLGITNAMLSRYLRGNSIPSVDKAYQLARIIGCRVDELFDDNYIE